MPGADWIPGVSHLKASFQAITGDIEGAAKTLDNFHKECPGVSQITSLVQLATGDVDGAIETQKRCLGTVNNVANGIPVVGHIKGVVHHIAGDHEGGNQALNAATRTTVVVASGAAAGLATGGIGAIPAGIAAGATYDVAATEITGKEQGCVAAMKNAVENPSAGAIFDAVVVPVGDGLAGYSGGQVASKISTQVKLSGLEAARASKLAQLEAGLETAAGGEAAGGGMTTGQAISLGKEINTLTSEINTINHGTPQFWHDVKTGEIVQTLENPNTVTVAVPGCPEGTDQNETRKETRNDDRGTKNTLKEYEDAIYYDSYVYDSYAYWVETKNTRQQKQQVLEKRSSEKPKDELDVTNSPYLSDEDIEKLLSLNNRDPNNDPTRVLEEELEQLLGWHWLYLDFPEPLEYAGAIQLNSDVQGLYHTFIRHMDEWSEFVDIPQELIDRLEPIINEIRDLVSLTDTGPWNPANAQQQAERMRQKTQQARNALRAKLRSLPKWQFKDVKKAMLRIQMLFYDFIRKNITEANFRGISMNVENHEQLNFEVKTLDGKTKIMVICVSDGIYKPKSGIDKRPIKIVKTIFFERCTKNFINHVLILTKEDMLKRRKRQ